MTVEERRVDLDEGALFVRSASNPPSRERSARSTPIVLAPGGPGVSRRHLAGFDPLLAERDVCSFERRDRGDVPWTFAPAAHAEDLDALCGALGASQVHLIGHGWGGLLAASCALARPERVASLVLVDAFAPDRALHAALARSHVPALAFACGTPFGEMGARVFDAMVRAPRQLCVLPRSGHFPWLDEPEVFFAEVRAFLREIDEIGAPRATSQAAR